MLFFLTYFPACYTAAVLFLLLAGAMQFIPTE